MNFLAERFLVIPGSSEEVNDLVVPIVSYINFVPLVLLQYSLPLGPTQNKRAYRDLYVPEALYILLLIPKLFCTNTVHFEPLGWGRRQIQGPFEGVKARPFWAHRALASSLPFRAQKSLALQGPPPPMALEMDLPASKPLRPTP
jgi:hypothetical protein